jgi:hypothetical protein
MRTLTLSITYNENGRAVSERIKDAITDLHCVQSATIISDDPIRQLYQLVDAINVNEPSEYKEVYAADVTDALNALAQIELGQGVTNTVVNGYCTRPVTSLDTRTWTMLEGQTEDHGGFMMLIRLKNEEMPF